MITCLLLCISMFGILIINVIDRRVAPINQVEFEEEKALEKEDIEWNVSFDYEKISHYIFIITPASVDISGDVQEILSGSFDVPINSGF